MDNARSQIVCALISGFAWGLDRVMRFVGMWVTFKFLAWVSGAGDVEAPDPETFGEMTPKEVTMMLMAYGGLMALAIVALIAPSERRT